MCTSMKDFSDINPDYISDNYNDKYLDQQWFDSLPVDVYFTYSEVLITVIRNVSNFSLSS